MGMSRKKQAIVEAGKRLFLSQGVADTTMDQVAEAAPVSKMTIYNAFGSKEGLLEAVVDSFIEEGVRGFEEACAAASDPLDALRRVAAAKQYRHAISSRFVDEVRQQYPRLMAKMVEAGERTVERKLYDLIFEGQRRGQIRQDLSAFVIVSFIRFMREYFAGSDVLSGADDLRVAGEQMISIMYHGIVAKRAEDE